jgi:hypothetical protein
MTPKGTSHKVLAGTHKQNNNRENARESQSQDACAENIMRSLYALKVEGLGDVCLPE